MVHPSTRPFFSSLRLCVAFLVAMVVAGCRLEVGNEGDLGGQVTSALTPGVMIACGNGGATCGKTYVSTGPETLTAAPAPNYIFSGWLGACEGQGAVCTLDVTGNSWYETRAQFNAAAVTVSPINDQSVTQGFAPFTVQANATSNAGTVTWSAVNSRPDIFDIAIDSLSGEIAIAATGDGFGNADVEVIASVAGGDASSTHFALTVPMPANPVFACGTGVETETGDTLANSYTLFEFGQSRPLAISPNGRYLFVTNTPANCLEIYNVESDVPVLISSVAVGLEPIAVAARSNTEVWVVNGLSDSVSVVTIQDQPAVVRTLLVGDEPRDIVFDGAGRAYITAAFRGQNHPDFDMDDLFTDGIGRADVWVFDPDNLGSGLGGDALTIINLFTDAPRGLAVSPDGNTVYAAGFMTGNETTIIDEASVADAGGAPAPNTNGEGISAPETGLIVKFDGTNWVDEVGTLWDSQVKFSLPDTDVFQIDASLPVPAEVANFSGVGTTLFGMTTSPDGKLFVSNTEARNHVRFEGPGTIATTVRGNIAKNRVTIIDGSSVVPYPLNEHIDFELPFGDQVSSQDKLQAIAQPGAMAYINKELWVLPFGSSKIQVYGDPDAGGTAPWFSSPWFGFVGLGLPDGGPAGIAVQDYRGRAYVYTRYGHQLHTLTTEFKFVINSIELFTPEPAAVIAGRPFLYDAQLSSGNGTASCGSCHIFGDFDQLAWDLGEPEGHVAANTNPFVVGPANPIFHPMKGPMTTQTLRGIVDSGPMHWRGDRTGRDEIGNPIPGETIESAAFKQFNPAFVGLVGRPDELDAADIQAFTDFALALMPPPNPVRNLDDSLTTRQQEAQTIYFNDPTDGRGTCNTCHTIDVSQNFFGTAGESSLEGDKISQEFKVPHLRNMYSKVGMYGSPHADAAVTYSGGDQIRGFGFLHDGSVDTLQNFLLFDTFTFQDPANDPLKVAEFQMVVDSNLKPIVGQQVTLNASNAAVANARIDLLIARGLAGDCDVVLWSSTAEFGVVSARLLGNGRFRTSLPGNTEITDSLIRGRVASTADPVTYTCAPPNSGVRISQVP